MMDVFVICGQKRSNLREADPFTRVHLQQLRGQAIRALKRCVAELNRVFVEDYPMCEETCWAIEKRLKNLKALGMTVWVQSTPAPDDERGLESA